MTSDPSRMTLWTGYFDSRQSRKGGRRVPKNSSVPRPNLDQIALAARASGITKMRRDQTASHPKRPFSKEGRLIISAKDAKESTNSSTKEEVMRAVGSSLRSILEKKEDGSDKRPKKLSGREGARKMKQRKSSVRNPQNRKKKKFGRR